MPSNSSSSSTAFGNEYIATSTPSVTELPVVVEVVVDDPVADPASEPETVAEPEKKKKKGFFR